jgi:hypothetical protein
MKFIRWIIEVEFENEPTEGTTREIETVAVSVTNITIIL